MRCVLLQEEEAEAAEVGVIVPCQRSLIPHCMPHRGCKRQQHPSYLVQQRVDRDTEYCRAAELLEEGKV